MKVENDIKAESSLKEEAKPEDSVELAAGKAQRQVLVSEQKEEPLSIDDFHNNDTKVLSVLNEAGSNYSFKGLMRKLNLHQQSLSRALHRLEEMGLVVKSELGYKLSKDAEAALGIKVKPKGREYTQLMQTYIPASVRAAEIVRQLMGRWFKNLRWVGMIESGTGYTLQWSSEDGSFQINLRLISDYVVIETNALAEKEKVQAMVGSYAIYEQITKVLQSKLGTYILDYQNSRANN